MSHAKNAYIIGLLQRRFGTPGSSAIASDAVFTAVCIISLFGFGVVDDAD